MLLLPTLSQNSLDESSEEDNDLSEKKGNRSKKKDDMNKIYNMGIKDEPKSKIT